MLRICSVLLNEFRQSKRVVDVDAHVPQRIVLSSLSVDEICSGLCFLLSQLIILQQVRRFSHLIDVEESLAQTLQEFICRLEPSGLPQMFGPGIHATSLHQV